ncbi:MAG: UDP-N-acetylmuramate:L-alanyl-gamma-D-glutamyl-meso-diaminopimelate ligase [Candidatus Binatia bacterium]|nr:MAG: UDP-N-acetylmuramate:L-alanyl-gamma-D-glutamyl-meso-diaminopimelate ligase [Candidatus Binatia bacterium]
MSLAPELEWYVTADPNNRVPEKLRSESAGHVHLLAVGGVAMSGLAALLRAAGFRVTGSDDVLYPPISTLLERWAIPVFRSFSPQNLDPAPDLVVVGNKITRTNAEARAVLERQLPYASLPQTLYELFLRQRIPVVVAGTHGKTTTTAMLAWIFAATGQRPSFLVGGQVLQWDCNARLDGGEHFILEGDEYDSAFFDKRPKFLHYRPRGLLLNAVEFDHADIYRDLDHVKQAFRVLVETLPDGAPLVVCRDFPHAWDVARGHNLVVDFGFHPNATWRVTDLRDDGRLSFRLLHKGTDVAVASLPLMGAMNARNALGAALCAGHFGVPFREAIRALESFPGVARRQQFVGEFGGVVLVDDFAHHPTAVAATLDAVAHRYPKRRLWALFEPRSNTSRRKVFQREYVDALARAQRVIVGGVLRKSSDAVAEEELFSPSQLAADLEAAGVAARHFDDPEVIAVAVQRNVRPGDVVVIMSNGDFGGLREKLLVALQERARGRGAATG